MMEHLPLDNKVITKLRCPNLLNGVKRADFLFLIERFPNIEIDTDKILDELTALEAFDFTSYKDQSVFDLWTSLEACLLSKDYLENNVFLSKELITKVYSNFSAAKKLWIRVNKIQKKERMSRAS